VRRTILAISTVMLTAACGSITIESRPAPPVTVTRTVSTSTPPSSAPASAVPAPAPPAAVPPVAPRPHLTNASAVVQQYYQDITDHDYPAAWALGGANISGLTYGQWVAGYATTANINLGTVSDFVQSQVRAVLYATQTDGTVKVYEGTYTVSGGVLVGASIRQTG
jgi:hypothetical protein